MEGDEGGNNNGMPPILVAHINLVLIIVPYNNDIMSTLFRYPSGPREPIPIDALIRIGDSIIPVVYHQFDEPPLQQPNFDPMPNLDDINLPTHAENVEMQVLASLEESGEHDVDPNIVNFLVQLVQATLEALGDRLNHADSVALSVEIEDHTGLSEEVILNNLGTSNFQPSSDNEESCCICLDEFSSGDELGKINCDHKFHFGCIKEWLKRKNLCPLCKGLALFGSKHFGIEYELHRF